MKYLILQDGERYEIDLAKQELLRLACCDCGLVHNIAFAIEPNSKLGVAMQRNARATAAKRRNSQISRVWPKLQIGQINPK